MGKRVYINRKTRGLCVEPDCGKPAAKIGNDEHSRCRKHMLERAEEQQALRDRRKEAGLCRCGNDSVLAGLKRCFSCTFGIDWPEDGVIDFVELFERAPRSWNKVPEKR